jgi:hypothetical protein
MNGSTSATAAWLARLAIVGLAVLASGCVNGVGWLPNASGFVYPTNKCQLVLFDLKTKAAKVLVADTGTNTYWPAVSPNGKRIAVAGLRVVVESTLRVSEHRPKDAVPTPADGPDGPLARRPRPRPLPRLQVPYHDRPVGSLAQGEADLVPVGAHGQSISDEFRVKRRDAADPLPPGGVEHRESVADIGTD